MNKQILNTFILSLLTLSCGQIAAHDPRIDLGEGQAASLGGIMEIPGNENRAPELPADVLVFLYEQLGLTTEAREDEQAKALLGMQDLPPELMTLAYDSNPQIIQALTKNFVDLKHIMLTGPNGKPLWLCEARFNHDGNFILIRENRPKHFHLFDRQGNWTTTLTSPDGTPLTCRFHSTFSPNGNFIAVQDDTNEHWHLFDYQGNRIVLLGPDRNPIRCSYITCSPNDNFIAAIEDTNHHCYLYDCQANLIKILSGPDNRSISFTSDIRFSQKGNFIAGVDKHYVLIFDYLGNFVRTLSDSNGTPLKHCFLELSRPYYTSMAVQDEGEHWYLFDYQGNLIGTLNGSDGSPIRCGHKITLNQTHIFSVSPCGNIDYLFDTQGNFIRNITFTDRRFASRRALDCSPSGNVIAAWDPVNNHCHLFNSEGNPITILTGPDGTPLTCHYIEFSPNESFIIGSVRKHDMLVPCHLFDSQGNRIILTGPDNKPLTYSWIEVSPNETYIMVQDDTNFTHLFDCHGNRITFTGPDGTPLTCELFKFNPSDNIIIARGTKGDWQLFDDKENFIETLIGPDGNPFRTTAISFSPDGEFINTSDHSGQCRRHLFKISNIVNIRRQLRRGITPNQFLMLKLLAGLKENWENDYPHKAYPTCPADITCALIQPKLPKLIQLPKGKQKKLVKSTYDWVLWNLNEFKKIKLSDDYTFYDLLCKTYHIEDDPIVQHPDYENNGLVAPGYLIPYVRLMTIQKHNTWWDDQGLRIALAPLWYLEQYLEASSPDYLEEESSELFDASSLSNIN